MDTTRVLGTTAPDVGSIDEELYNFVPLRRPGTPEDMGRAVVFLCSPAAGCITGVALAVDGGLLATA